jgi:membrane fusion protein, multidrug efflux system
MNRRLHASAMSLVALAVAACAGPPPDEPNHEVASAAVAIAAPVRGGIQRIVVGWGEVSPGPTFQRAVSIAAEGAPAAWRVAPGEHVRAGQVLGQFVLSGQARLASVQAATSLNAATVALARARRLRADQLATDEQVAQAEKTLADAKAAVAALPAVDATGGIAIKAPEDGSIAGIVASAGQVVPPSGPLVTITPSSDRFVAAGVEPREAALVRPGMRVMMTPPQGGDGVGGYVAAVGDAIDGQTRLVPLRVVPDGAAMPGSAWRVEVAVGEASGWIVPADAVVDEDGAHFIYQVRNGKALRVPVDVAAQRGDTMALNAALDPALPIVIAGAPQLADGMIVATSQARR